LLSGDFELLLAIVIAIGFVALVIHRGAAARSICSPLSLGARHRVGPAMTMEALRELTATEAADELEPLVALYEEETSGRAIGRDRASCAEGSPSCGRSLECGGPMGPMDLWTHGTYGTYE
jgi:hypothetical protein